MSCAVVCRGQRAGLWLPRKKACKCTRVTRKCGPGPGPSRPGPVAALAVSTSRLATGVLEMRQ